MEQDAEIAGRFNFHQIPHSKFAPAILDNKRIVILARAPIKLAADPNLVIGSRNAAEEKHTDDLRRIRDTIARALETR